MNRGRRGGIASGFSVVLLSGVGSSLLSSLAIILVIRALAPEEWQGLFKVVVAAWCRVDTPWVRYKPGGHGGYRDRGGCLTSTADRSESCRARTRIFSHPGR